MAAADALKEITDDYVRVRQTEPFPGRFREIFDRLAREVAALPSVCAREGMRVRAGFGIGNWTRSPWLTIMARSLTETPQQGVFVSFKFPQDMRGVYVTLNQGHRLDSTRLGRRKAREHWAARAEEVRQLAGGLEPLGFRLDGDVDLGLDDANAAADFRASTVAWRFHPAEGLPNDTELDREIDALLDVYLRWLESRPAEAMALSEEGLEAMRARFLKGVPGFVSFQQPGEHYMAWERGYKLELAEIFRAEVLPLLTGPLEDAAAAEEAIAALHALLTRRRLSWGGTQNLLGWRGSEHLARLKGEEALRAAGLMRELLAGEGGSPERVEAFNVGYVPILARYMRSGVQGVSRTLPTLLLMLSNPEEEIVVRTTLFDEAAQRLLGHRLLSGDPLTAEDYEACLALARAVRRALEAWGWAPNDMIDVQSFLWVSDPSSYDTPDDRPDDRPFGDALDPESGRRIWKVAPGQGACFWRECLENGYVRVGWDAIGDLRQFAGGSYEEFRDVFRETFADSYLGAPGKLAIGARKAREVWSLREMEPGDIVLANRGVQEVIAMGEVVDPGYAYDTSRPEHHHTVRVRWNTDLRRDLTGRLSPGLRASFMNSAVLELSREDYATILDGPREPAAPPPRDNEAEIYTEPPFPEIVRFLGKAGLRLSERMIRRYHVAVKSRGFVILAGVTGTGKTWLAETYADAMGAQRLVVPVAPNWNSNEDLLGFTSPVSGEYQHTPFSRFLVGAAEAAEKAASPGAARPFHVVLDEMNLARVEHYFSAFLSALEQRNRYGHASLALGAETVGLYRNLVFVGTVNMDETTHGFAHKVYDRAQLLEVELDPDLFAEHVATMPYAADLVALRETLETVAPFAMRTADDIGRYVDEAVALGAAWQDAFDEAVLQKVLPRVRGMDPSVGEALEKVMMLAGGRYPLVHAKAQRMLEGFRLGIASFF